MAQAVGQAAAPDDRATGRTADNSKMLDRPAAHALRQTAQDGCNDDRAEFSIAHQLSPPRASPAAAHVQSCLPKLFAPLERLFRARS